MFRPEGVRELTKDVEKDLSSNQKSILKLIKKNKYISAKELSEEINISLRNIQKNLENLKAKGFLKRVGPDRGGYWEILYFL